MSKLPYAFAAIALVLAFSDVRDTANNALTEREEGGLALLTSMIVGGGFAVRRLAARSCPRCDQRVGLSEARCHACGADMLPHRPEVSRSLRN